MKASSKLGPSIKNTQEVKCYEFAKKKTRKYTWFFIANKFQEKQFDLQQFVACWTEDLHINITISECSLCREKRKKILVTRCDSRLLDRGHQTWLVLISVYLHHSKARLEDLFLWNLLRRHPQLLPVCLQRQLRAIWQGKGQFFLPCWFSGK